MKTDTKYQEEIMAGGKPFQKELLFLNNNVGDVYASICFLYIQYCKKGTNVNDELLKIANQSFIRYLKLSNKDGVEIGKEFDKLCLELKDYPEVIRQFVEFKSEKSKGIAVSNRYVCELIDKLLDIKPNDIVLDLGSAYGSFLAYVSSRENNRFVKPVLIGQEINLDLANSSKMLLEMLEANYSIENIDSITSDSCPSFTKGYVFPPFGLKYNANLYDSFIQQKPELFNGRVSSSWLFIFKALSKLKANGKIVAIVNEGSLFQSADANIRKYLIDNGLLEGIVSLPYNSINGISTKIDILVLSNGNKSFKIVDGDKVLDGLPIKGLNSHEAAVDLFNAYNSNFKAFTKEDIHTIDCCLTMNSLMAQDIYKGMNDLVNLTDVVEIIKGCSLTLSNFEDSITESHTGTKILTSGDIDEYGMIDYDSMKNIIEDKKLKKYYAQNKDVILSSKSTKVKIAVFREKNDDQVLVTGGMIILRPKSKKIDSLFLKIFFSSTKGMELLNSIQKGLVITTISLANLSTLKIPCPDIDIQREIVKKYLDTIGEYQMKKMELRILEKQLNEFYDKYER